MDVQNFVLTPLSPVTAWSLLCTLGFGQFLPFFIADPLKHNQILENVFQDNQNNRMHLNTIWSATAKGLNT